MFFYYSEPPADYDPEVELAITVPELVELSSRSDTVCGKDTVCGSDTVGGKETVCGSDTTCGKRPCGRSDTASRLIFHNQQPKCLLKNQTSESPSCFVPTLRAAFMRC